MAWFRPGLHSLPGDALFHHGISRGHWSRWGSGSVHIVEVVIQDGHSLWSSRACLACGAAVALCFDDFDVPCWSVPIKKWFDLLWSSSSSNNQSLNQSFNQSFIQSIRSDQSPSP